ncbi:hypothetical protein NPIL_456751 [Nephila pilipes]|uniref:Uncharacterized protein n=1 Tax=Nephila pilipes TaxID=299642 RepID=A0A8X6QSY5_NEPPI|nr:hypothetical protein NPIL_456751 [Nephila pilipes]
MSIVRFRGGLLGEQAQEKKVYSSGKEMVFENCDGCVFNLKAVSGYIPCTFEFRSALEDDIYADILSPKFYIMSFKDLEVKRLIYPENLP